MFRKVSGPTDPLGTSLGIAIGHLAMQQGMLTPEQLREALLEQSKTDVQPLEAILLAKGLLTPDQIRRLHSLRETTVLPGRPAPADALVRFGTAQEA